MKRINLIWIILFLAASCSSEQPVSDVTYYHHGDFTVASSDGVAESINLFLGNIDKASMRIVLGHWMQDLDHNTQERFINLMLQETEKRKALQAEWYENAAASTVIIVQRSGCPLSYNQYLRFSRFKGNEWYTDPNDRWRFREILDKVLADNAHITRLNNDG